MASLKRFQNALHYGDLQGVMDNISSINGNVDYYLYIPAYQGHLHIVEYLVNIGADPNNYLALRQSICGKNLNVIKYLHEHGAIIYETSVMDACQYSVNDDIIKYLLINGSSGHIHISYPEELHRKRLKKCMIELAYEHVCLPDAVYHNINGELVFPDEYLLIKKYNLRETQFKARLMAVPGDLDFMF